MRELNQDDFMQALIAALAVRGVRQASIRTENYDPILATVFQKLEERAPDYELELDFEIVPDPTHKDSGTVRDALATSAADGLVSYDNPEYQDIKIMLGPTTAGALLRRRFSGLEPLFEELAEVFVDQYATRQVAA
jgi:hypothetical protein